MISINHNNSNSSRKITNYISKLFILSLIFEYIIFVIFYPILFSGFIESQMYVKVNASNLTFDFFHQIIF